MHSLLTMYSSLSLQLQSISRLSLNSHLRKVAHLRLSYRSESVKMERVNLTKLEV